MQTPSLTAKPHYPILDGLRGIAAIIVVAFHLCETHSTSHLDQIINHGYLAVDFFFLLSGFVVGYAYDDRWGKMTLGGFFKRRLIRLQPMVVMGMIVGAIGFYFQDSAMWPTIHLVPLWKLLLIMALGFTLIPVPVSMDIRGWQEMHPLDGPGWSLFFEYIANILYGLFIRKFSKTALGIVVVIAGAALVYLGVTSPKGDVIGGWSITSEQLHIGFTRLLYPFFAGLLLSRIAKPIPVKQAFVLSSILLVFILALPRIGGSSHLWLNGLYDSLSIIIVFPLIVFMGANGAVTGASAQRICHWLGAISYPLYITHYPLIYWYTGWVSDHHPSLLQAAPVALLVLASSITLAYACLKWYDEPIRRWLQKKVL